MDVDRYIAANSASWARLEELTRSSKSGARSHAELEEFIALYQRTSAQLSFVRSRYRDRDLVIRLTRIVAGASGVIYGKRVRSTQAILDFFRVTFPAAVWHLRRFVAIAALVMFVPAIIVAVWLLNDPAALDASASPSQRTEYVENQFEQYYSDQPSALFFTKVTVNNISVSFMAFVMGTLACLPGVWILLNNGLQFGVVSAWMISAGDTMRFFGLILPHGALELTAIVIAGGAGLHLGWTAIVPGDRSRPMALAEEGRRSVVVILGLVAVFTVAGLIEGFVTGSGLPTGLRVGLGAAVWMAFVTYIWTQGRIATAQGFTGSLGENERGHSVLTGVGQSRPVALTSR